MKSVESKKYAEANLESLNKIFTLPEDKASKLFKIEEYISKNLHGFLKNHIAATSDALSEIEKDFLNTSIPEQPHFVSDHADFILKKVVAHSVNTASPTFIGHMTSAIPYFMLPLGKIMMALNQNLVKVETSKAFTPLERQVVAMLHKAIFQLPESFYPALVHSPHHALGLFCSGGTIANLSALWVARNKFFNARNINLAEVGLGSALADANIKRLVILVSELGHYSLQKAADVLGIGRNNLIKIETDAHQKINLQALEQKIQKLEDEGAGILSLVGIAGTTETGHVDPLENLAALAKRHQIHFHVDAAWGGPTIFSKKYRKIIKGIEHADSITLDPHKQLYVPMGNGIVIFKDPEDIQSVRYQAEYVIRKGSKDLGKFTLEGSRPGTALLVHAALHVMARQGYELLVDIGIEKAHAFASMIEDHPDFELVTHPELNLLTYRFFPRAWRDQMNDANMHELNSKLNTLNINLQKTQRERGKSFVSRTLVRSPIYKRQAINVLRVVLANPLTTEGILHNILNEQALIGSDLIS